MRSTRTSPGTIAIVLPTSSGKTTADGNLGPEHHERLSRISSDLLRLERQTAVRLRNEGRINDETLRQLEHELDLREAGPAHVRNVMTGGRPTSSATPAASTSGR